MLFVPTLSSALVLVPFLLVTADPLTERAQCNANNCLRALRRRGAEAASSCISAYGVTALVTRTEFVTDYIYTLATVYTIVRNPFTVPAFPGDDMKRAIATPLNPVFHYERRAAAPEPTPPVERREAAAAVEVPPYASACSGTAGFASACSCLTVETTVTKTQRNYKFPTTTTVGVCDYRKNYGYNYTAQSFTISGEPSVPTTTILGAAKSPGRCCKECFETAECLSTYYSAEDGCKLFINKFLTSDFASPRYCPYGGLAGAKFELSPNGGPPFPLYGQGPCAKIL